MRLLLSVLLPSLLILAGPAAGPGAPEESAIPSPATPPADTQPAATQSPRKYEVACKYPPGQYVVQRTVTAGEGFNAYVFKQVMGLTIAPSDAQGDRRVTLQIERLQTYTPHRRAWDSDDPPAKAEAAGLQHFFHPLLKVPLTAIVDARGEWRDFSKMPDTVWNELTKSMPTVAEIPRETFIKEQFFPPVNDQQNLLPPGPVAIGEKWEAADSVAWPPYGRVHVSLKRKLVAVEGQVAVIETSYRQVPSAKGGAAGKAPPAELPELEATSTVRFDMKRGMMESRLSDTHFKMELDGQRRRQYLFIEETIKPRPVPATTKAE